MTSWEEGSYSFFHLSLHLKCFFTELFCLTEIDSVSSETDPSENVIDLHGDPNDELDVEYVLRQMGLPYTKDGVTQGKRLDLYSFRLTFISLSR